MLFQHVAIAGLAHIDAPRRLGSDEINARLLVVVDQATEAPESEEAAPLVKEADPELERLLAEEEEIERSVRDHHETPHFRPGDGD